MVKGSEEFHAEVRRRVLEGETLHVVAAAMTATCGERVSRLYVQRSAAAQRVRSENRTGKTMRDHPLVGEQKARVARRRAATPRCSWAGCGAEVPPHTPFCAEHRARR